MTPVVDERPLLRPPHRRAAVPAALLACLVLSAPALAQREFVEEVDNPKASLDDVDLDAPDAAEAPKKPAAGKTTTAKAAAANGAAVAAKGSESTPAKAPDLRRGAAKPPPAGDREPAVPDGEGTGAGVRVLETTLAAFLEKWDVRAATVRKGEIARARKLLPDVDEALLDLGVQGIAGGLQAPATATALLVEARRALNDGNLDEAAALVDAAERAAPDLVAVHSSRALVLWTAGDLGGTLTSFAAAISAQARDPLASSQVLARVLALLLAAVVLLLALLAALAGLPALRLLSFDVLHALPKGAHGGQVLALVVIAGVAPLVVGAGPVFGSLWVLSLAWLYLTTRERVLTGVVAVLCLALPAGVDAVARLSSYPGSRADRAQRALFDAHAEPLREALKARPPAELDDYERAALAMWDKREGRLDEARRRFEGVTRSSSLAEPELAFAHGGLGVIAALQGDETVALEEIGKALSGDPRAYTAAFDASVLHYRGGRTDKAESAVAPVAKEAPALLNAFRRTTYRAPDQVVTHNRAFVDVYPQPLAILRKGLASTTDSQDTAEAISRSLLRGELGTRALAFLAAFLLAWLLLLALGKKLAPAQGCVRCGHPASRRVDSKDVPADTCSQCFHAFVSTKSRIDAGVKLRKEREIIQRRTRLGRAILLLGVLCPGAGHIFGGAPVRGALFASLHTLGLGALLFASGIVPMPRLAGPWSHTPPMIAAGVLVGVVWLLAMRSALSVADDASGRGRRR